MTDESIERTAYLQAVSFLLEGRAAAAAELLETVSTPASSERS